jgi:hypothetical protein
MIKTIVQESNVFNYHILNIQHDVQKKQLFKQNKNAGNSFGFCNKHDGL